MFERPCRLVTEPGASPACNERIGAVPPTVDLASGSVNCRGADHPMGKGSDAVRQSTSRSWRMVDGVLLQPVYIGMFRCCNQEL